MPVRARSRSFETALVAHLHQKIFLQKPKPFGGPKYPAHVCCATLEDGLSTSFLIVFNASARPMGSEPTTTRVLVNPTNWTTKHICKRVFAQTPFAEQLDSPV